jgi:hypothetical protein
MNRDLFLAILSMDSYNRGYGASLNLPVGATHIGRAKILPDSEARLEITGREAVGFYAIAYDMSGVSGFAEGERVISYRGTDGEISALGSAWDFIRSRFGGSTDNDVINGYGVALGHPDGPQALLALEFYRAVAANDNDRDARLERPFHFAGERAAA